MGRCLEKNDLIAMFAFFAYSRNNLFDLQIREFSVKK